MEIIQSLLLLFAVYMGHRMGKGEPIIPLPSLPLKRIIRSEAQEAELIKKLEREQRIR